MKAHDELLWTSGRAKVAAGQRLTDAETEVLKFYGGAAALRPIDRKSIDQRSIIRKHITPDLVVYTKPSPIKWSSS